VSDDLAAIAELRSLLGEASSDELAGKVWNKVLMIESQLQREGSFGQRERELMRWLRDAASDVLSAWRDNAPSPPVSAVLIAADAIERHLMRGRSGADGHPLP
jgi:hypothetical protein